jgi:hypothetical protein
MAKRDGGGERTEILKSVPPTRVRERPQNGRPKAIKTTVWNDGSVTTLVVGCPKTQLKYVSVMINKCGLDAVSSFNCIILFFIIINEL